MPESIDPKKPSASDAATSLSDAERLATRVRSSASQRLIAWLAAIAVASVFYLTGIGVAGDDWVGVTALSAVLGFSIVGVTGAFLSTGVVASGRSMRRWRRSAGVWLLVFGVALGVGLPLFPGDLWFWIPVAFASAVPLVVGAIFEARA